MLRVALRLNPRLAGYVGAPSRGVRLCVRHAATTTYGVVTGLSLPVYSGGSAENAAEPKEAPMNEDTVGGYAVPVDPMDLLQCDSCQ